MDAIMFRFYGSEVMQSTAMLFELSKVPEKMNDRIVNQEQTESFSTLDGFYYNHEDMRTTLSL